MMMIRAMCVVYWLDGGEGGGMKWTMDVDVYLSTHLLGRTPHVHGLSSPPMIVISTSITNLCRWRKKDR